jgi:hypothetical protein
MCELCPIGSYSNSDQVTVCSFCEAGQFSNDIGASGCHVCNPGTFSRKYRHTNIFLLTKTWTDAAQDCSERGTHLVTIDSRFRNSEVTDLIASISGSENFKFWIGFSRQSQSSKWEWTSGSDSIYSNWAVDSLQSEINNTFKFHGNCAVIVNMKIDKESGSLVGAWKDVDCYDQSNGFICESPFYSGPSSCVSCASGKHSTVPEIIRQRNSRRMDSLCA